MNTKIARYDLLPSINMLSPMWASTGSFTALLRIGCTVTIRWVHEHSKLRLSLVTVSFFLRVGG